MPCQYSILLHCLECLTIRFYQHSLITNWKHLLAVSYNLHMVHFTAGVCDVFFLPHLSARVCLDQVGVHVALPDPLALLGRGRQGDNEEVETGEGCTPSLLFLPPRMKFWKKSLPSTLMRLMAQVDGVWQLAKDDWQAPACLMFSISVPYCLLTGWLVSLTVFFPATRL